MNRPKRYAAQQTLHLVGTTLVHMQGLLYRLEKADKEAFTPKEIKYMEKMRLEMQDLQIRTSRLNDRLRETCGKWW